MEEFKYHRKHEQDVRPKENKVNFLITTIIQTEWIGSQTINHKVILHGY